MCTVFVVHERVTLDRERQKTGTNIHVNVHSRDTCRLFPSEHVSIHSDAHLHLLQSPLYSLQYSTIVYNTVSQSTVQSMSSFVSIVPSTPPLLLNQFFPWLH